MGSSFYQSEQPKPFYLIFSIELWERFSFYGVQAFLALYFVEKLSMSASASFITFAAFSALCFGLIAIGGLIGDRLLGARRTLILGAMVLMIGYGLMALAAERDGIYRALGTIAVGNGLFKASPSSLLAKCYKPGDARLDGAFTLYYMAINSGSLMSILAVPYIVDSFGWSMGFLTSVLGMALALGLCLLARPTFAAIGSAPDFLPVPLSRAAMVLAGIVLASFVSAWVLKHLHLAHALLIVVGLGVLVFFFKEMLAADRIERRKMMVALMLMGQAIVFFVLYMQMPMTLNFFALANVQPRLLGITVNPLIFQSLNPFWVILLSPALAYLYHYRGCNGGDFSMPSKFALGMFCSAGSFMVLPLAARFASDQGLISAGWIVLSYFFQAMGELLISGLGLAMVARLVPERLHGLIMGAWFLTSAAASVLAGFLAGFAAVPGACQGGSALQTLPVYSRFFETIGLIGTGVALLMLVTAPMLGRLLELDSHKAQWGGGV